MRLVIKIGGSLAIGEDGPKFEYFKRLLPVVKEIDKKNQLILVIGGGGFVRKYYEAIKKFKLSNKEIEWIAIDILRTNTRLLSFLTNKKPIFDLKDLNEKSKGVIGGFKPGRSTDANAAYAAKTIKANLLIKLTDVDGIYNKDPKKFKKVKKIDQLSFKELANYKKEGNPGSYGILDKLAIDIIIKNKIKTIVTNGKIPKNILKVLKGKTIGTMISN